MNILLALLPLFAHAASPRLYQLDMKYYLQGKLISSPRVVVIDGKSGEVSSQQAETGRGEFVEVTPRHLANSNQVQIDAVLGVIEHGKKKVLGRPRIIALENEEASVETRGFRFTVRASNAN